MVKIAVLDNASSCKHNWNRIEKREELFSFEESPKPTNFPKGASLAQAQISLANKTQFHERGLGNRIIIRV